MMQFLQRRWLVPHPSLLEQLIIGGMTELELQRLLKTAATNGIVIVS